MLDFLKYTLNVPLEKVQSMNVARGRICARFPNSYPDIISQQCVHAVFQFDHLDPFHSFHAGFEEVYMLTENSFIPCEKGQVSKAAV